MRPILLCSLAALALAGCGGKSDDKTGTSNATATASGIVSDKDVPSIKREPGSWKTSFEMKKMDIPGMPDGVQQGINGFAKALTSHEECVTPEKAASEDYAEVISRRPDEDGDCKTTKREINGDQFDIAMFCTDEGKSGSTNVTVKGIANATKSDMVMTVQTQEEGKPVNIEFNVKSERTGACK